MQINIPDELVARLVTAQRVVDENGYVARVTDPGLSRDVLDDVAAQGQLADQNQMRYNAGRAAQDRLTAIDAITRAVLAAGGYAGKAEVLP
jgi:hypothetical protein